MLHWKWRFTRYSPFTRYGHFSCSPTYWISSKRSVLYIRTFSTLSGVRIIVCWILPQLDIFCTSAVRRYYAKNDNSPFKCHLFSRVLEFTEARKTCHRVVRTSVWLIPYSGELCNKNCIDKTSETLIVWSASWYTAGPVSETRYRGPRPTAKMSGDGVYGTQ